MWHQEKQDYAWSGTLCTVLDPGLGEEVDVPIQGWLTPTSVVKGADREHGSLDPVHEHVERAHNHQVLLYTVCLVLWST